MFELRENAYDRAIRRVEELLSEMGEQVGRLPGQAVAAARILDRRAAKAVEDADDWVDDRDYAIEAAVLEIISLQQPRGEDLRSLAAVLRMSRDLERVADYAVDVARAVPALAAAGGSVLPEELERMADQVARMLLEDMAAFRARDVARAGEVPRLDDAVDQEFRRLRRRLIAEMGADPTAVEAASTHLLMGQYLERSGDHAVNVAEMVVYRETGRQRPFRRPGTP
ncbi:MAG: phosphate signaling complex protein PhoU [Thermaerobacter sp.]|nr:phosphate signaling complex protein PhoU [Thermaerobacter sp.]